MIAADNEAGAKEVSIHDNTVGANSQVGAGQCHGIIMGSGASRFRIKDNRSGNRLIRHSARSKFHVSYRNAS